MSKYAIEVVWVGWSNTKTITESSIITVGQGQARKIGSKIGESKKKTSSLMKLKQKIYFLILVGLSSFDKGLFE